MRRARWVATLGVLALWCGVLGAGALVEGYSPREDYISSLASRGSPVALLGVGALLAGAVAHVAAASAVLDLWRARSCAASLLAAAVASTVVALFRTSCPDGPAGCGVSGPPTSDWVDRMHGIGVGAYEVFTVLAMLVLVAGGLRRAAVWPRWLALLSLGMAVTSVLLLARTGGEDLGAWQRLWLATNHLWLLVVVWTSTWPASTPPRADGRADEDAPLPHRRS